MKQNNKRMNMEGWDLPWDGRNGKINPRAGSANKTQAIVPISYPPKARHPRNPYYS